MSLPWPLNSARSLRRRVVRALCDSSCRAPSSPDPRLLLVFLFYQRRIDTASNTGFSAWVPRRPDPHNELKQVGAGRESDGCGTTAPEVGRSRRHESPEDIAPHSGRSRPTSGRSRTCARNLQHHPFRTVLARYPPTSERFRSGLTWHSPKFARNGPTWSDAGRLRLALGLVRSRIPRVRAGLVRERCFANLA